MSATQALDAMAAIAQKQLKPKATKVHAFAASQHRRIASAIEAKVEEKRESESSSPSSAVVVAPVSVPVSVSSQMRDSRVFQEVLNDMLHDKSHTHYMGKMIDDTRYARLVAVCRNPNDPDITRSEKETIAHHKYVAGNDDRLFCWKPGCVKDDFAAGSWPADMFEVVKFSDIARVIQAEHIRLAGAKAGKLYESIKKQYKGITVEHVRLFCKHCACCAVQQIDNMKSKRRKIKAIKARSVWFHVTFDLICMMTQAGGKDGEWLYILTVISNSGSPELNPS
jgi:hypothetical protein